MFGIGDNQQHNNDDPAMLDNVKQLVDDQAAASATGTSDDPTTESASSDTPSATDSAQDSQSPHAEPAQGFSSSPLPDEPADNTPEPEENKEETVQSIVPTPNPTPVVTAPIPEPKTVISDKIEPANPENLASLKEEALGHLEPLIEHLGGKPEEVFRTTMMMIQANDNHTLISKALDAAKKIEDDKVRAKAMLDIINEINYFTQGVKSN